jgi:transglutaminase-like putative cysteine protease/tetratricopeptide (TPR) repeat protein
LQRCRTSSGLVVLVLFVALTPCFSQSTSHQANSAAELVARAPSPQNPYDARLSGLQVGWNARSSLERALTLRKIYGLREYVNLPQAIASWIASVAQDTSESPLVRDQALHYAALMNVHAGKLAASDVPPLAHDLRTEVGAALAQQPTSPPVLELLGLAERDAGLPAAQEHLEAAVRRAPTAERWMEVAEGCADSSCTYQALVAALRWEPNSAAAKTALADYYIGRKQLEKARDLLREAVNRSPNDFVARKRLADLCASAGLKSVALAEYRKLEADFPAPLWLRRELAARYEEMGFFDRAETLAKSELAQNFDDRCAREILVRIYQKRGEADKLRAFYADMIRLDPGDTRAMARLAALEAGEGRYPAAESVMRKAIAIAPDDEALRQQYADVLEAARKTVQARTQLAHVLDADPSQDEVRRRLAWKRGPRNDADSDASYLVNAAEVARQAQSGQVHEIANASSLADVRIERVQENGLSSLHVQQVFQINTDQGAREYSSRTVQYAACSQRLRIVAARLYKSDGSLIDADQSSDAPAEEGTAAMFYDARSRTVRFPGVERGDVIELDYRLTPETKTNPYGRYFADLVIFRSSLPERLQRYVLITPASQKFNILETRMPVAEVREVDGRRIYRWDAHDMAALPNEPKGPAITEIAPYVHVSSFATWQEVGQWYAQLIAPQFALDNNLRQALAQVLAGKNTEQEKIQAIHQFVLRNTHYVALEFGIYGYKPYPVSQVFARRFGDCKDKASLMIALLRAAGIDAQIALVRTRRLGNVGEQATSIAIFNHAVVYVPKYDLWLDGTAEYAGSRELPLDDQDAMALTIARDGAAQLRRIPVTLPMENYTHRQVQARILPDGKIEFTGSAYTRGEDAPGLRREYEVAERQRDSVRSRLAEVLPSVRVDDVQVYGANDLEHDVTVKFSGEVQMFAGRPSLLLATSWMPRSYVQTLASLPSRAHDLLLPAPWTTEEELHFALPAGARLQTVPQDKILETPFGSAVLRYQRQGNELVVTTSVQFRKLRITPSEYGAFRNFCAQVESAFRAEIKVGLKG